MKKIDWRFIDQRVGDHFGTALSIAFGFVCLASLFGLLAHGFPEAAAASSLIESPVHSKVLPWDWWWFEVASLSEDVEGVDPALIHVTLILLMIIMPMARLLSEYTDDLVAGKEGVEAKSESWPPIGIRSGFWVAAAVCAATLSTFLTGVWLVWALTFVLLDFGIFLGRQLRQRGARRERVA